MLRADVEAIAKRLETRGIDINAQRFQELEAARKEVQSLVESAQASRNKLAREIGQAKAKGEDVKELLESSNRTNAALEGNERRLEKIRIDLQDYLDGIPNIPHESVPVGKSAADNVEIRRDGAPRQFGFAPRDHVDIGAALKQLDFETAAKIAGARFALMKGPLARLHRAIAQFMLDLHTREHGYTEVYAPYLVNAESMRGTGQLPKFEADLFAVPRGDEGKFYLIPTAEVPVTNIVRDEIVPLESLPLKFVCHSPCFRSEAGSHGKDTRGMIRNHQFDKVELVQIVHPEKSYEALENLTGHAEEILKRLKLPYRVVTLCTGDMGFAAAKTYDIEVWLPGQNAYREISSCSNFEAFQARRMQARFRKEKSKPELVHTLNGSGLAVGRTLIAIMENCQRSDGGVNIPAALQPYMGDIKALEPPR
jgi:seryl-tRNA synthetase